MDDRVILEIDIKDDGSSSGGSSRPPTDRPRDERGRFKKRDGERSEAQKGIDDLKAELRAKADELEEKRKKWSQPIFAAEGVDVYRSHAQGPRSGVVQDLLSRVETGESAGSIFKQMASAAGASNGPVGGIVKGVGVGLVAGAAASLVRAFAESTTAAKLLAEAHREAKEAAEFSPDIISAEVESEQRRITSRIDQGERIGEELAMFIRANSSLEVELREIKTTILKEIVPVLAAIIEMIAGSLGIINDLRQAYENAPVALRAIIAAELKALLRTIGVPEELFGVIQAVALEVLEWIQSQRDAQTIEELDGLLNPNNAFMQADARRGI